MRRHAMARGLLVGVCCLLAADAFAQDDAFKKGMDARDDQKWPEVVQSMQDAIRADPKESTRKVGRRLLLGGNEYLPHFYLGEAFFRSNNCAAALGAWDESEQQGVIRKMTRELGILRKGAAECEAKGFLSAARLPIEVERASAAIRAAAAAEQEFVTLRASHADAVTPDSRTMADRARADLASAREALEPARRARRTEDLARVVSTAEGARRAYVNARGLLDKGIESTTQLTRLADEAERTIAGADQTAQALASLLKTSPARLSPAPALVDARRKAEETLKAAKDRLAAARKSRVDADVSEARTLAAGAAGSLAKVFADFEALRNTTVENELRALDGTAAGAFAAVDTRLVQVRSAVAGQGSSEEAKKAAADLTALENNIGRARKRLAQAVAQRDLTGARAAVRVVTDANTSLDRMTALIAGAPAAAIDTVPDILKQGADAFFKGRYQEVLDTLSDGATAGLATPLRVHGHVLRAASLLALYEYSGRQDDSLRARARQDVDAGKRLDPAFQPNPAAFTPKFLAFFAKEQ